MTKTAAYKRLTAPKEAHASGLATLIIEFLGSQKLDPAISNQFGGVPFRSIGHLLEVRVAEDFLVFNKVFCGLEFFRHLGVPLAKQRGAVSGVPQAIGKQRGERLGPDYVGTIRLD